MPSKEPREPSEHREHKGRSRVDSDSKRDKSDGRREKSPSRGHSSHASAPAKGSSRRRDRERASQSPETTVGFDSDGLMNGSDDATSAVTSAALTALRPASALTDALEDDRDVARTGSSGSRGSSRSSSRGTSGSKAAGGAPQQEVGGLKLPGESGQSEVVVRDSAASPAASRRTHSKESRSPRSARKAPPSVDITVERPSEDVGDVDGAFGDAAANGDAGAAASWSQDMDRLRMEQQRLAEEKQRLKNEKKNIKRGKTVLSAGVIGASPDRGAALHEGSDDGGSFASADSYSADDHEPARSGSGQIVSEALLSKAEKKKAKSENKLAYKTLKQKEGDFKRQKKDALKAAKHEKKRERQALARVDGHDLTAARRQDIKSGWLLMRGSPVRTWVKRWFVLRPGQLFYYASEFDKHPIGIVNLKNCTVAQRDTRKRGYCLKIVHSKGKGIYMSRGIKGEPLASGVFPAGADNCILRDRDLENGPDWVQKVSRAIATYEDPEVLAEAARFHLKGSVDFSPIPEANSDTDDGSSSSDSEESENEKSPRESEALAEHREALDDGAEILAYYRGESRDVVLPGLVQVLHAYHEQQGVDADDLADEDLVRDIRMVVSDFETRWVEDKSDRITIFGSENEHIKGENKGIIMGLIKQIRPGMDLSKVVMPAWILEPRSMLEKLTDFMTHSDILSQVKDMDDPLCRLLQVLRFYVSGLYIRPKGVKKPYNPIVGEFFRCMWPHYEGGGSGTAESGMKDSMYYVAEQVSHHPPVSAFTASNRKAGFVADGAIIFGSKFMGTSAAVILNGFCTLTFPELDNESYEITFPDMEVKGFIAGPLVTELANKVSISCPKTGYRADLDFKTKGMFSFGGEMNLVEARVRNDAGQTLYRVKGKWDERLTISESPDTKKYKKSNPGVVSAQATEWMRASHELCAKIKGENVPVPQDPHDEHLLWWPCEGTYALRARKYKPRHLHPWESDRLWKEVTDGLDADDVVTATEGKAKLEAAQRAAENLRRQVEVEYKPRLFEKDQNGIWRYKFKSVRPWQDDELWEVEDHGVVSTRGPLPPAGERFDDRTNAGGVDMVRHRRVFDEIAESPAAVSAEEEKLLRAFGLEVPSELRIQRVESQQEPAAAQSSAGSAGAKPVTSPGRKPATSKRRRTRGGSPRKHVPQNADQAALAARMSRVETMVLRHMVHTKAAETQIRRDYTFYLVLLVCMLLFRLLWLEFPRLWL